MLFFTSDLHLGHKNVLHNSNRPFASIEEMEETIIKNWNKKVQEHDTVYVLGDTFWGYNSEKIKSIMNRLNGYKVLIIGNHDKIGPNQKSDSWLKITPYEEIVIDNEHIILSHYPIAEWNRCWYGSYHLYGHCHGHFNLSEITKNLPHKNTKCMDVGVDTNNYEPYSWNEIKAKLS